MPLTIRIRWRDIDALAHVNNAVYLMYLDELLTAYVGPVLGGNWVSARVELDFRSEIKLSDVEVAARAAIERIGTSSITTAYVFALPDGTVALEGRAVLVAWDPQTRRSRPLTETERQALAELES
jgi:acyl-CoA thioester hydrolase